MSYVEAQLALLSFVPPCPGWDPPPQMVVVPIPVRLQLLAVPSPGAEMTQDEASQGAQKLRDINKCPQDKLCFLLYANYRHL